MADFNTALDKYVSDTLDFKGLQEQLDQALAENPEQASEIISLLEDLLRSQKLSTSIYLSLKERIEQFDPADIAEQMQEISSEAEEQPTRLVPPSVEQPVECVIAADNQPIHLIPSVAPPAEPVVSESVNIDSFIATPVDRMRSPPPTTEHTRMPEEGATLNGRFVLEKLIGRGGMGAVYKARDLRKEEAMDRDPFVAVKVLNEEFHGNLDAFIILQREAKKAQRLAHPNIATVYDFDRDGDTVYMTMELLKGESLEHLVKRVRPNGLPPKDVLPIIEGMAKGLGYAHERRIAHSDFKPGNAFITEEGVVKVLDFGIARAVRRPGQVAQDATLFDPSKWEALTPAYASCEMFDQADPDPRDDIYALACVAYELLAGRHPFNRLPANQARQRRLKPKPIPGLKPEQNQALMRGLAFDRHERTSSVAEFIAELKSSTKPVSSRWKGAVVVAAAVLVGGGIFFFIKPPVDVVKKAAIPQPVALAKAPETPEIVVPDAEMLAKIERIMEVADLHFLVGRLIEPEGSNAAEAYQAILEYHPTNKGALAGLEKIAMHFEQQALASFDKGDMDQAMIETESGLKAYPRHPRLLRLQERIKAEVGD